MKREVYLRVGKRLIDVVVAPTALMLLSPLLVAICALSRIFLGSPIIFSQLRAGYQGKPFTLYKFRSMRDLRDSAGRPLPDEQRLTPYGMFLRRTSIDELPGLWNVLRGEMSLIGPRPLLVEYTQFYTEEQALRLTVKPGMAGYAALFGRNSQSWESLFEKDAWYARNVSFWLDMKIIFRVIVLVATRKGIDRGGHDVGSPFAEILRQYSFRRGNLPEADL